MFKNTEHAANLFALKELGNIYTRIGNPTQDVLEQRMAQLEGGAAALALASGTSAIFYTIINICSQGDEVVSANNLYGGTFVQFNSILPQLGITVRLVDPTDPDNFKAAINERTRAIYCETLGNPSLNMTDLEALAKIAREHNLPLIVDSTFTPPCILKPIDYGANVVIHSLTKWIGGHGTSIGGIVVDAANFNWQDPKFKLFNEPDRILPRPALCPRPRRSQPRSLCSSNAAGTPSKSWGQHQPGQLLGNFAGHRDTWSENGASLRKCRTGCRLSHKTRRCRLGTLSRVSPARPVMI